MLSRIFVFLVMCFVSFCHGQLNISGLKAVANDDLSQILNGVDMVVNPGEIHIILGPNGCGKSTLAKVLAGHPDYEVTGGVVDFFGKDLISLSVHERALNGLFLALQQPPTVAGVSNEAFLRASINAHRRFSGESPMDPLDMYAELSGLLHRVGLHENILERAVNDGFSGGERKRFDLLQLAFLKPKVALLDETDSGLDVDALKVAAGVVQELRKGGTSFIVVTHYRRLLELLAPISRVHVMRSGRIVESGGIELADRIDRDGFRDEL